MQAYNNYLAKLEIVNAQLKIIEDTKVNASALKRPLHGAIMGTTVTDVINNKDAIANEVVTNPDIFFLDEPDSGLDPKSGMELMNNLKNLSGKGKIVMLISHNYASYPNPEKIYTKVIILAKSNRDGVGRLAFMGSVPEALYFFGVKELKDITKLINPKSENGDGRADEFVERFRREYMK